MTADRTGGAAPRTAREPDTSAGAGVPRPAAHPPRPAGAPEQPTLEEANDVRGGALPPEKQRDIARGM